MAKSALPTLIPNEAFAALERRVVDAGNSLPSIDKDTGFYKVAKHYYFRVGTGRPRRRSC